MLKTLSLAAILALTFNFAAQADCADALTKNEKDSASLDAITTTYAQTLPLKEGHDRAQIAVKGMMCSGCAGKIENAVKTLPGVDAVAVHLKEGSIEVAYNPKLVKPEALVKQVNTMKGGHYKASLAPANAATAAAKSET